MKQSAWLKTTLIIAFISLMLSAQAFAHLAIISLPQMPDMLKKDTQKKPIMVAKTTMDSLLPSNSESNLSAEQNQFKNEINTWARSYRKLQIAV